MERVNPAQNKEKKIIQEECEEALNEGTTKDRLEQLLAKANERLKRATERTTEIIREIGAQDTMLIQWKKITRSRRSMRRSSGEVRAEAIRKDDARKA